MDSILSFIWGELPQCSLNSQQDQRNGGELFFWLPSQGVTLMLLPILPQAEITSGELVS